MARRITFIMNPLGMRQMLNMSGVRDACERAGRHMLVAASASAPVGETGGYRDSLRMESDTTDRPAIRIVADVPYAMNVEADHGTLARSLDAGRSAL